jgi:hypothetical protein
MWWLDSAPKAGNSEIKGRREVSKIKPTAPHIFRLK